MKLLLANPRGFCAGVDRAIEIVKKVLEEKGSPIYVKHEVVHIKIVVKELENLGAVFVEEISDIPKGETVIYSAHGVSKTVVTDSNTKDLDIKKINTLSLMKPNFKKFSTLNILNLIPDKDSLFETVLITTNDELVEMFLNKKIEFNEISF